VQRVPAVVPGPRENDHPRPVDPAGTTAQQPRAHRGQPSRRLLHKRSLRDPRKKRRLRRPHLRNRVSLPHTPSLPAPAPAATTATPPAGERKTGKTQPPARIRVTARLPRPRDSPDAEGEGHIKENASDRRTRNSPDAYGSRQPMPQAG